MGAKRLGGGGQLDRGQSDTVSVDPAGASVNQ